MQEAPLPPAILIPVDHITGEYSIMDETGHDDSYKWDKENADSIEIAQKVFQHYKEKGYLAHVPNTDDIHGEIITDFNPSLSHIIFTPPMGGG